MIVRILLVLGLLATHAVAQPALTKPPQLVTFVAATYPPGEPLREARVTLEIDVAADGKVAAARVTGSAGKPFDDAALAAVKRFVFTPGEVDHRPAPATIVYEYVFRVEAKVEPRSVLAGVVRDKATRQPLVGVTVSLDTGELTATGETGAFTLDPVTPGTRTISIWGPVIAAVTLTELVEPGKRHDVVYDVATEGGVTDDPNDLEIVIDDKIVRESTTISVTAGVARRVPGTGGDVLRVVESMPGVARAAAGSGQLVVWGASPDDTRVYVDGVRIPRLYHAGGLRSVIAADLVRSIELAPGGWGAEHGRSLGGLVDIALVPLDDNPAAAIAVDALDTAGALRIPIRKDLRAAVAARKSQLGWLLDRVTDEDVGELVPIPSYLDGQARLAFQPSSTSRLEAVALGSSDRVTRIVANPDPAATKSDVATIEFWRAWTSYHQETLDGAAVDVVVFGGRDRTSRVERFGARPTELDALDALYGVRASWRKQAGRISWSIGLDAELLAAELRRRGAVTSPSREGDIRVFGQPPPDQLAADAWGAVTASAAPYAQADIALAGGRLHVVPGLRFEPFFVSVSRRTPIAGVTPSVGLFGQDTTLQPRLAVRYDLGPRVRLSAAAGRYHQPPQPEDVSAVFGNPTLPITSATHLVAGVAVRWTKLLATELTGFTTRSSALAVRSPSANPRLAQALEPIGEGRAIGIQALVRRELAHGVFGWVSYTLSRAERTDAPGMAARRFDFDQTHVLTALVSWDLGRGFELGARFRYATGAPRTPVVGTYYDNRSDQFQPMFGAHNSDRLPAFAQLDARLAKRFTTRHSEGEVYLDLQNVTDRDNAEEIVYSPDFTTRGTIQGLPILPVLGARWSW